MIYAFYHPNVNHLTFIELIVLFSDELHPPILLLGLFLPKHCLLSQVEKWMERLEESETKKKISIKGAIVAVSLFVSSVIEPEYRFYNY